MNKQFWIGLGLSILSGVMLILSYPPFNHDFLMWIAFVPSLVAAACLARHGWQEGLFSALPAFMWVQAFFWDLWPGSTIWFSFFPVGIGVMVFLLWWGDTARQEKTGWHTYILNGATVFVVIWLGFSFTPIGTLAFPAYTQFQYPVVLQIATLTGMWGVGFILLAVNHSLALLIIKGRNLGNLKWQIAGVAVLLIAMLVYGLAALDNPAPNVRVAAVQVGELDPQRPATYPELQTMFDTGDWTAADHFILDLLEPGTREAAAQGVQLIVWPEYVLPADPALHPSIADRVSALVRETGAYVVVPYFTPNATSTPRFNQLAVYNPQGEVIGHYRKQHPAAPISGTVGEVASKDFPTFNTDFGTIAALICMDGDYPNIARNLALNGASLIAQPAADGIVLNNFNLIQKHYPISILRAVENRVVVVRSEETAGSTIVDPYGRLLRLSTTDAHTNEIIVADVPLLPDRTLYTRWGDWFAWLCVALFIGTFVFDALYQRSKSEKSSKGVR